MLSGQVNQTVELWSQQLTEHDMPVFSGTVSDITNAINRSSTSATDVATGVLKDASLMGDLLKMANSFHSLIDMDS
jgi:HD-like signal output (HDOD) protein